MKVLGRTGNQSVIDLTLHTLVIKMGSICRDSSTGNCTISTCRLIDFFNVPLAETSLVVCITSHNR